MKATDNGALLALGVVGLAAVAGRVKRGSFGREPLAQKIDQIFSDSEEAGEVDSSQIVDALYDASEARTVPADLRAEADELLARSEEEEYLDSGEGMDLLGRIRDALGKGGSRAKSVQGKVGGGAMFMPPLKPGGPPRFGLASAPRVVWEHDWYMIVRGSGPSKEYLCEGGRGNKAYWARSSDTDGYALSYEKSEDAVAAMRDLAPRAEGSRAVYGMSAHDAGHVLRLGMGKPRSMAGEALNDYRWHPERALAQHAASKGKRKGRGGSRAFLLDDPEYTLYVVHVPSMKIASGWSYAEDAKEALADMGSAKAYCKVYTRKYLKDKGLDPRHNGNWASRGQF